jgi:(hydroxyamino)benzene mutase
MPHTLPKHNCAVQRLRSRGFLLALGAAWSEVRLSPGAKAAAFWTALYGSYVNWLVTSLAAAFGTGALSPITAPGRTALAWQEQAVTIGFISVAIAIVLCSLLVLWGLCVSGCSGSRSSG